MHGQSPWLTLTHAWNWEAYGTDLRSLEAKNTEPSHLPQSKHSLAEVSGDYNKMNQTASLLISILRFMDTKRTDDDLTHYTFRKEGASFYLVFCVSHKHLPSSFCVSESMLRSGMER